MSLNFVQDDTLVTNEHHVRTIEWDKPIDKDYGIYDPTVKLEMWQFVKLSLNDQLDYLCHHACLVLKKRKIHAIYKEYPVPCSPEDMIIGINQRIAPRQKISEHYRMTSIEHRRQQREQQKRWEANGIDPDEDPIIGPGKTCPYEHHDKATGRYIRGKAVIADGANRSGWFNYDRYKYVYIKLYKDNRWRSPMAYSAPYRTTFICLLLQFLIEYGDGEHDDLTKALDYYETAMSMVKKPRKFHSV
jgi:hypothetical protein